MLIAADPSPSKREREPMSRVNRRVLEVEVLENRCTPSTVPSTLLSSAPLIGPKLPNGTPSSQAATLVQPNGSLTVAQLFNFAAPSPLNQAEIPFPNNNLILQSEQLNTESPGMFASEISSNGFNVNNGEALETNVLGTPAEAFSALAGFGLYSIPGLPGVNVAAGLGMEMTLMRSQALAELVLTESAGLPSTVPFPLPSYYDAMPVYDTGDTAIAEPSYIEFESFSPFMAGGLVRSSYEGGNGAGLYAPPTRPTATPPSMAPTTHPISVEWLDDLEFE